MADRYEEADIQTMVGGETIGLRLTQLQGGIENLAELIKLLEERVDPILSRPLTKAEGGSDVPGVVNASDQSPIAESIEMYSDRVACHTRRLLSILDRINL